MNLFREKIDLLREKNNKIKELETELLLAARYTITISLHIMVIISAGDRNPPGVHSVFWFTIGYNYNGFNRFLVYMVAVFKTKYTYIKNYII